ncbi:Mce protein [Mycobacterium sp.]|uniref:Mce protein n=1 Tax=Mycobacterium sp. TaxID=1785 RepID=UPI003F96F8DB
MEEDAGPNRLTPPGAADSPAVVAVCDPAGPKTGADMPGTEAPTEASEANAEDAGAGAPNAPEPTDAAGPGVAAANSGPSRLSRRWLVAIAAALVLLAGGIGAGGYLALRAHRDSQAITRADAAAVVAAKDCVAATQPTDAAALPASQQKLSECSTRAFGAQIAWYSAIMAEAFQAVNVRAQVPAMRAAVERNNDDGSIVVLVAFRTTVSQVGMADRENSYRLRVKMVPVDGQFKIAELDQVAK